MTAAAPVNAEPRNGGSALVPAAPNVTVGGNGNPATKDVSKGDTARIGTLRVEPKGSDSGTGKVTVEAGGALNAAKLVNGGIVGNQGGWIGPVTANSGSIGNIGSWTGNVETNTGKIGNAGQWSGNVASNAGTIGNAGVWIGHVTNSAGGTFVDAGTITSGVKNAGTIEAIGSVTIEGVKTTAAIDGPITNTGTFDVAGPTTEAVKNFYPASTKGLGLLSAYTSDGAVTSDSDFNNFGTLTVSKGGSYAIKGNLRNEVGATVTVKAGGSLSDDLINSGTYTNSGTVTANVRNSGSILNSGTWTGAVTTNTGSIGNDGTWTGAVSSNAKTIGNGFSSAWTGNVVKNTGTIGNAGTWTGDVGSNAGTIGSAGLWKGHINNSAGGTFVDAGVVTGGLNNAGTVTAIGNLSFTLNGEPVKTTAAINGAITNKGLFVVAPVAQIKFSDYFPSSQAAEASVVGTSDGKVVSKGNFDNAGVLQIENGGSYAIDGDLTNAATGKVVVQAGGSLTDDLINAGTYTNAGTVTANTTNSGAISNSGTWTGSLLNAAGGTVTNSGTWNGDATNQANGIITNSGTFSGNVTNAGKFVSIGSGAIGQTLTNAGTIDLTQGGTLNTLSAKNYVGQVGSSILVDIDLRGQSVSPTGGQATLLTFNTASGPAGATTLVFKNIGGGAPISYYPTVKVVSVASGSTSVFAPDAASLGQLSSGLISYSYNNGNLLGAFNPAAATAAGVQTTTVLTTLNTNFFQDWQPFERQAFITAPQEPPANTLSGGPWIRGKYGNEDDDATSTAAGVARASRVATEFSGFQVGADLGNFNTNGTGWNFIGGITGGEFFATSNEKLGGTTKGTFEIPFVGAYVAATKGPFFVDVLYHHDFYGLKLNDAPSGLANQSLSGSGDSVHIESAYTIALSDFGALGHLFVAPTGSVVLARVNLDTLPFQTLNLGKVKFDTIDSILGHGGLKIGSNFATETLALQPFVIASVWHEFEGKSTSEFDAASGIVVPMTVSRIGTFGQVGVGLNGELLGKNVLGTIRGDFRFGDKTSGESVTGQLRYQF